MFPVPLVTHSQQRSPPLFDIHSNSDNDIDFEDKNLDQVIEGHHVEIFDKSNMKSHKQSLEEPLQNEDCPLCAEPSLTVMLNRALYDRYLTNADFYYSEPIELFVNEEPCKEVCLFKEQMVKADDEEQLRRVYAGHEFQGKIELLSEYYKFHRDLPRIFGDFHLFKALGKYYDRLRNYDYKKIKHALKNEQGISLTTQKSCSSFENSSEVELKSRYSDMLGELNNDSKSESKILNEICDRIGTAFKHVPHKKDFKGQYFSGQKKFEEYLQGLNRNSNRKNELNRITHSNVGDSRRKNYNLYQRPSTKGVNTEELHRMGLRGEKNQAQKRKSVRKKNQQNLAEEKNMLKETLRNFKKIKNRNVKSIEKTTANQTISREQRSKRFEKLQRNLELEIERNSQQFFKPLSTGLIALKSNTMLKTIDQIYRPSEKYHSDKGKKGQHLVTKNLNRIYEDKLNNRYNSYSLKGRSKVASAHTSKEMALNPNIKDLLTDRSGNHRELQEKVDDKAALDHHGPHHQEAHRSNSKPRISRSKSVSKVSTKLTTIQRKSSQKRLQSTATIKSSKTIEPPSAQQRTKSKKRSMVLDEESASKNRFSKTHKRPQLDRMFNGYCDNRAELQTIDHLDSKREQRPSSTIKRSKSRTSVQNSGKKQAPSSLLREKSQKSLHKTQTIGRTLSRQKGEISCSKENRRSKDSHKKYQSHNKIKAEHKSHENSRCSNEHINDNIERILEKKLTVISQKNVKRQKSKLIH